MIPALVLQQGPNSPAALLGEWAQERGLALEVHRTDESDHVPDVSERPFVCCLGSRYSPLDRDEPIVMRTLEVVGEAVTRDIPVLGLCYGGQVLADVLGGSVGDALVPENGWYSIDTDDPELVPAGPWLEWHYQRFTLPPGAREIARSAAGTQAFTSGPHLGVQFHPESTIEIVKQWAARDTERLAHHGVNDAEERLEAGRAEAALARDHAFQLFDGFWQRAQRAERRDR